MNREPVLGQSQGKLHIVWVPDDYVTLPTDAFKKLIDLANGKIDDTCTCGRPRAVCPSGHWAGIQRYDTYVYYIEERFDGIDDWEISDLGIWSTPEAALAAIPNENYGVEYQVVQERVR